MHRPNGSYWSVGSHAATANITLTLTLLALTFNPDLSRFIVWHKQYSFRKRKPDIKQVQALPDISCSALCCHRNETHAPIANPPNSAQLERTPTIPPSYILVRAVVRECGEGQTDTHRHTHTHTHRERERRTAVTNIHFISATH